MWQDFNVDTTKTIDSLERISAGLRIGFFSDENFGKNERGKRFGFASLYLGTS